MRDGDAVPKLWQKHASSEQQLFRVSQAVEQLQRQLNRLRMRGGSGDAAPSDPATGMVFRGWWSNVASYNSQEVVFRTPSGGSSGVYIAVADNIPQGTLPEVGAPHWAAFPYPPPGVWG